MNLPPLKPSDHPENRIMQWSKLEMDAIQDYARQAVREAVAAAVPEGYKLVMVPEENGPEPNWEEVRYQAETATGLTIERSTFSIIIREVRRWIAAAQEVKP